VPLLFSVPSPPCPPPSNVLQATSACSWSCSEIKCNLLQGRGETTTQQQENSSTYGRTTEARDSAPPHGRKDRTEETEGSERPRVPRRGRACTAPGTRVDAPLIQLIDGMHGSRSSANHALRLCERQTSQRGAPGAPAPRLRPRSAAPCLRACGEALEPCSAHSPRAAHSRGRALTRSPPTPPPARCGSWPRSRRRSRRREAA
jgi:hypothetical protein